MWADSLTMAASISSVSNFHMGVPRLGRAGQPSKSNSDQKNMAWYCTNLHYTTVNYFPARQRHRWLRYDNRPCDKNWCPWTTRNICATAYKWCPLHDSFRITTSTSFQSGIVCCVWKMPRLQLWILVCEHLDQAVFLQSREPNYVLLDTAQIGATVQY